MCGVRCVLCPAYGLCARRWVRYCAVTSVTRRFCCWVAARWAAGLTVYRLRGVWCVLRPAPRFCSRRVARLGRCFHVYARPVRGLRTRHRSVGRVSSVCVRYTLLTRVSCCVCSPVRVCGVYVLAFGRSRVVYGGARRFPVVP